MSLKKQLNLYIWIWVLYLLQGIIYPEGIIGQVLFLVIMGYSFLMMLKVITLKNQPRFITSLTILVALYFIYGVIRIVTGIGQEPLFEEYSTITYIKTYMLSLCPIYVFYYCARKGIIDEEWFRKYVFLFMILTIVMFLDNQFRRIILLDSDEITNNVAYNFVAMLPICLFWQKKPLVQYLLIVVSALFVLISMKRGAILIFSISVIPFLYRTFKNSSKKMKSAVLLGIFLLCIAMFVAVQRMIDSSDLFRLRIEQTMEGNSSNRDIIYEALWNEFSNNYSAVDYLLGRGADASIEISGKFAHNDWLETVVDQGLVGIIIFLVFWSSMLKTQLKMKKGKLATTALLIIFVSGFIRTFFSMSIGQMPIYYTAVLGYCIYEYSLEIAIKRKNKIKTLK